MVYYVNLFYRYFIPLVLGCMALFILTDILHRLNEREKLRKDQADDGEAQPAARQYPRFELGRRIEHLVLISSFTTLALTGLPQKYSQAGISQVLVRMFGGIAMTRQIHHLAAAIFILEAVYHLVVLGYKLVVLRFEASMLPSTRDGMDALRELAFNLGLRGRMPRMGRYNFKEKMEYWALVFGLLVMALTGLMLWNPVLTIKILPAQFIPAAQAAHGAEAVLAVLAIILWHFYSVHLRGWNASMFTGKLSLARMKAEHAEELDQIEKGMLPRPIPPVTYRRRMRLFVPATVAFTFLFGFGLYKYTTFEPTPLANSPVLEPAIQVASPTVDPTAPLPSATLDLAGQVVLPQTATPGIPNTDTSTVVATTSPTPAPVLTWTEGGIQQLFSDNCGECHGDSGGLSLSSYADIMEGGRDGPVIIPGNPDDSRLVKIQSSGNHPVLFSAGDLAKVIAWIKAGALEK